MSKTHLSLIFLSQFYFTVFSQQTREDTLTNFTSFSLEFKTGKAFTIADYKNLAPNSSILLNHYDASYTENKSSNVTVSALLEAGTMLYPKNHRSKFKNPTYMVGLVLFENLHELSFSRSDIDVTDTLSSSQSGQKYYLQSELNESIQLSYKRFSIGICLAYRTDILKTKSRINFTCGFGIQTAFSFKNQTELSYQLTQTLYLNSNTYLKTEALKNERDKINHKSNFIFNSQLIAGIVFQPRDLTSARFFYEFKPTCSILHTPESGTKIIPLFQHFFGIRLNLKEMNKEAQEAE